MIHPAYAEAVTAAETVRRILDLRETLVRFDENLAAWHLLSRCVPYWAVDHPVLVEARDDQYAMVRHVLPQEELRPEDRGRDPYADYYASNVHEAPFETQYGIGVEEAHRIPRVQFLLDGLQHQMIHGDRYGRDLERAGLTPDQATAELGVDPSPLRVLDLSANDGWMAARLAIDGYRCDCLDLHPGNVALAHERRAKYPLIGRVEQGALEEAAEILSGYGEHVHGTTWRGQWDAVVMFETVEHVRDPRAALAVMCRLCTTGGRLYVSTPNGAMEQGNLPTWAHVEPKGHVRVYTPDTFRALLEEVGEVEELVEGPDRVLVARVAPR